MFVTISWVLQPAIIIIVLSGGCPLLRRHRNNNNKKDSIFLVFFNYLIALIKNHWKDFVSVFLQRTSLFSIRTNMVITLLLALCFTP